MQTGGTGPSAERLGEVASVKRALAVLGSFSREQQEFGVNELARLHGLHPSSMSRLLATMAGAGFVRVNPTTGRYRLGYALVELGGLVLQGMDIREVAQPIMHEMMERGGETANLAVLDGRRAVVIGQAQSPRPCRFVSWVGRRVPLYATAHGRVLLAFRSRSQRDELIASIAGPDGSFPLLTEVTSSTVPDLEAELARTVDRGYAISIGEMDPDLAGVAAPIFDHSGAVVASLSLSGPSFRYREEDHAALLASLVAEGAERISAELGWCNGGCATPLANSPLAGMDSTFRR